MAVFSRLAEIARLQINRIAPFTDKEKLQLHTALDAQATLAIEESNTYTDAALAAHVADPDPHTQYLEHVSEDPNPILNGMIWPAADGSADQVLKTDGANNLAWVNQSGGGGSSPLTTKGDLWGFDTVDNRLPVGTDGQVLSANSAVALGVEWIAAPVTGLSNVVEDTTPQFGGDMDVNGNSIVSVSAGDILITPDTTGNLVLDGINWPQADGSNAQVLSTNGSGQLGWATIAAGSSPSTGYGSISVDSNATTTTFVGSSTDWTNKVQITVFDTNGDSSTGVTPDHTNDHVTVVNAGPYLLHASLSFAGAANATYSFAFFKNNGATQVGTRTTRKLGTGGDIGACDISVAADLSASDTIELWVQNEGGTGALILEDANLEVVGLTGLGAIVEDTTPQLGSSLDVNGNAIVSASNGDIAITPDGTGNIILDSLNWPQADGTVGQFLSTDGAGNLSWSSAGGGTTFVGLTDTPSSFSGAASDWVKVNAGATALIFTNPPVQSISASLPLSKSGTTSVSLSIAAAAGPSTDGYMTGEDKAKLDTITANADETSTANVAAAGAVMDSDFSSDGLMARTAAGAYASRTIVSANDDVTITNGNGDAGNPNLAVAGIGGKKVTISASAPGSPSLNDIWIDIS